MNRHIRLINNLTDRFGFWAGINLFLNFKTRRLSKLRLPGIPSPIAMRHDDSDYMTFGGVFFYPYSELDLFDPPKVIVDAGAHIGLFSVFLKSKFPEARIISVEPDPENYGLLEKNLSNYPDIKPIPAGLWREDTRLRISDKYNTGKWGMVTEEAPNHGAIKGLSMNTLMDENELESIDLLKIDIEGSEWELFDANYEKWLARTKVVMIEIHDWMRKGAGQKFFEAVQKCMANYAYVITHNEITIIINQDLMEK